jgi:glutamate 5-kinase
VVMVTSGAIALGMRLMGFDDRPRAVDEHQAATAVGPGALFRANALLLGAKTLVLLTDTSGLHTADPHRDPGAELIERVDDFSALAEYDIGDRTSPYGSGGMRSKVAAAEMATAAGIDVVVCDGTADGTLAAAATGEHSSSGCGTRSPRAAP